MRLIPTRKNMIRLIKLFRMFSTVIEILSQKILLISTAWMGLPRKLSKKILIRSSGLRRASSIKLSGRKIKKKGNKGLTMGLLSLNSQSQRSISPKC